MSKIQDSVSRPQQEESRLDSKTKTDPKDKSRDLEKEGKDFADLLKKPQKDSPMPGRSGGLPPDEDQGKSLAASILQSMHSPSVDAPKGLPPSGGSPSVGEVVQAIADKVLVSDKTPGGKEEIRILLKESVMPATEVRIVNEGGSLRVELITGSNDAFQLLSSEKIHLEQRLMDRLKDPVSVEVRFQETGREDNQGRSRQQRSVYDETLEKD